ncbi:DUF4873 domain-containing protein [Nocardioides cavernaquae]|uniref:DUF4873 domain-containing protein n=1 Tax=Nocardioides cavernaquae TaxID=2321396 RepID=A0A3A5H5L8_9ACTN|nr:DUF4873 domain-containing protein [Nocardioides cavernaquae]RJS45148.1 DUF4873 domain-containing protein [Nocardioides cavernaquae]
MTTMRQAPRPIAHSAGAAYDGPAEITVERTVHAVEVQLRSEFQPLDGHTHWHGRIAASSALPDVDSGATITLHTPFDSAAGRLSDRDPWGRFRISGLGRPPF